MGYIEVLKCIGTIISIMKKSDSKLDEQANGLLYIAETYLNEENPNDGLVRQALQHMETAAAFLNPYAESKTAQYNELCVLIAYMHKELGDPENIVDFWIYKIQTRIYPPSLLKEISIYKYEKFKEEYWQEKRADEQRSARIYEMVNNPFEML